MFNSNMIALKNLKETVGSDFNTLYLIIVYGIVGGLVSTHKFDYSGKIIIIY